jgi:hypothetical protein
VCGREQRRVEAQVVTDGNGFAWLLLFSAPCGSLHRCWQTPLLSHPNANTHADLTRHNPFRTAVVHVALPLLGLVNHYLVILYSHYCSHLLSLSLPRTHWYTNLCSCLLQKCRGTYENLQAKGASLQHMASKPGTLVGELALGYWVQRLL